MQNVVMPLFAQQFSKRGKDEVKNIASFLTSSRSLSKLSFWKESREWRCPYGQDHVDNLLPRSKSGLPGPMKSCPIQTSYKFTAITSSLSLS